MEVVLKVLDGRAVNGRFWVFYGALSNVEYAITVEDTVTGARATYVNPAGRFASVAVSRAWETRTRYSKPIPVEWRYGPWSHITD